MKSKINKLSKPVVSIISTLAGYGYEAYAVGGCIRDILLGREPKDWDITTSATPLQVKELFARTVDTGLEHGTVTVLSGQEGFEVTTYRIDGKYEDGRHPKEVTFTPSLFEDLKRRDFTVNAMAYNPAEGLIDPYGGMRDLKQGIIRCVGNPIDRFGEDALRMLRAIRFAAQLGFTIAPDTRSAITALSGNLHKISAERIQAELVKLVVSPNPQQILDAYETGITSVILPEFDRMMETPQNHLHHCFSVGRHTVCAMQHTPSDKILRLAALFHDIAKPDCKTTDGLGIDHFYGHPAKSAQMAKEIFRRLKFDCDTMERVSKLVYWHDDNPALTGKHVRKAIAKIGKEQFPALFAVKRADILAQSQYKQAEKLAYVDLYEKLYHQVLSQGDCIELKQLAISGHDLLALGIPQGRQIGEILKLLLEQVLEEPDKNNRPYLLQQAQQYCR